MNDPANRLEEYLDGLLPDQERSRVEEALARDPEMRAELERARDFEAMLGSLRDVAAEERAVQRILTAVEQPGGRKLRIAVVVAAAAVVLVAVLLSTRGTDETPDGTPDQADYDALRADWVEFGQRLGEIAAERRTGRVPRKGVGDMEIPPALGYGVVFVGALDALHVELDPGRVALARDMVKRHFVELRRLGRDAKGEYERAERSLDLYRDLRSMGGSALANAYYDVFRPALATPRSVGPITEVLKADRKARYVKEYDEAYGRLRSRYGDRALGVAIRRLEGADRRFLHRDATQDGVGPDAVLAIRSHLYRVAARRGLTKLYLVGG